MVVTQAVPPIRLVPFAEAKPHLFTPLLCDGWTAHDVGTFARLVPLLRTLQAEHPDCRILASLDDLGQASYTSGHTIDVNDLDEPNANDGIDSGASAFAIRHANLVARAIGTKFADVTGQLDWGSDDNDPIAINTHPDQVLMLQHDSAIVIQRVPVARAADALAAFPNGYFTVDLSPMQNHALARHLEDHLGFALFGVGASYLSFWRTAPLDAHEVSSLGTIMATLYADVPSGARDSFATLMRGRDILLVRYTES
jgi:hypothetical protein